MTDPRVFAIVVTTLLAVMHLPSSAGASALPDATEYPMETRDSWKVVTLARGEWDLTGGAYAVQTNRLYLASSPTVGYKGIFALRFFSRLFYANGAYNDTALRGATNFGCTYLNTFSKPDSMNGRLTGMVVASTTGALIYADGTQIYNFTFPPPLPPTACSNCGRLAAGQSNCDIPASGIGNGSLTAGQFLPMLRSAAYRESTDEYFFVPLAGSAIGTASPRTAGRTYYVYAGSNTAPGAFNAAADYAPKFRTEARMSQAWQVAFAQDRWLFYTDNAWHVVGRIDMQSGEHTILTGNGAAGNDACNTGCIPGQSFQLTTPTAIAVYEIGTSPLVFIAERTVFRIRVYYTATNLFATAAGTGAPGVPSDGPALLAQIDDPRDLSVTPFGLVIVEPKAVRFVYFRRPNTPTVSASISPARTETAPLPTPAPPTTTTVAPTTTAAGTPTSTAGMSSTTAGATSSTAGPTATTATPPPVNTNSPATTVGPNPPSTSPPSPATVDPPINNATTTGASGTPSVPASTTGSVVAQPTSNPTTTAGSSNTAGPGTGNGTTGVPPSTTVAPGTTSSAATTTAPPAANYECGTPKLVAAAGPWPTLESAASVRPAFAAAAALDGNVIGDGRWAVIIAHDDPTAPPPPPPTTSASGALRTVIVAPTVVDVSELTIAYAPGGRDDAGSNLNALLPADRSARPSPTRARLDTADVAWVEYPALPRYDVIEPDRITISAPGAAFVCVFPDGTSGRPPAAARSQTVSATVTISPTASAELTDAALAATTTSVAAAAALNPAAATGAQAAVVMSFLSCASPAQRKMGDNVRLLAPLMTPEDSIGWMAASNGLLLGAYTLVLGAAVGVVSNVDALATLAAGDDAAEVMAANKCARWEIIAAKLHFPSSIFTLAQFLLQGLAFGTVATVVDPDTSLSDVGWVLLGGGAWVAVVFSWLLIHMFHSERLAFITVGLRDTVPPALRIFIPHNTWAPEVTRRMYAFNLSQFRELEAGRGSKTQLCLVLHHVVGLSLICGVMSLRFEGDACIAQAAVVSALFFIWAAIIAASRPYRRVFYNVTFAGQYASNGLLFAGAAAAMRNPKNAAALNVQAASAFMQMFFSAAAAVYTAIWVILELIFLQSLLSSVRGAFASLREKFALPAAKDSSGGEFKTTPERSAGDGEKPSSDGGDDEDDETTDDNHEPLLRGAGSRRRSLSFGTEDAEEIRRLEQYWGTSIPGLSRDDEALAKASEPPRGSRSRLAEAIGVDELPEGVKVYRGDWLNPDGSVASPSRPPQRKHVRICDAPDTDTSKLPPPPPLPPMSAEEAAAVLGLRAKGLPPPPPRPCDLLAGTPPPPPPPPEDDRDDFEGLASPFDAKLSLVELSGAVEACAEIAGVVGVTVADVVACAVRTARRRYHDRPPGTKAALATMVGNVIVGAAPRLKPGAAPGIDDISNADAQTALIQLAAERRVPPLTVYGDAVAHALRCRLKDPLSDMDAPLSRDEVALAIHGLLAAHRAEQRPTAEHSLRRGMDLEAALASGGRSASAGNGGDDREPGGSKLLRPVTLQQAALPFTPEAASPGKVHSRTAMAVEATTARSASVGSNSTTSGSPRSRDAMSAASPSPVRAFTNPYRTLPYDSALPPSRYEADGAGRAAAAVESLLEQRYAEERRAMREKLRKEQVAAAEQRRARERAREERRREREQRIARLTAARIARDRADRRRLGVRVSDSDTSDEFDKYI